MIMGADAPWCEFGQFKRSSTKGGFRQKVHRCRRNKDVSSAAKQATTGLTRRLPVKPDSRSSKSPGSSPNWNLAEAGVSAKFRTSNSSWLRLLCSPIGKFQTTNAPTWHCGL